MQFLQQAWQQAINQIFLKSMILKLGRSRQIYITSADFCTFLPNHYLTT